MKIKTLLSTVCVVLLAMASFADISKPPKPLEIVLIFETTELYPTNPPTADPTFRQFTQILFRNVGEKTINVNEMLSGLSIVWDGKEYKQDTKRHRYVQSDGQPDLGTLKIPFSPFDFLIPQDALTPGWHTLSAKAGDAESNRVSLRILKR